MHFYSGRGGGEVFNVALCCPLGLLNVLYIMLDTQIFASTFLFSSFLSIIVKKGII